MDDAERAYQKLKAEREQREQGDLSPWIADANRETLVIYVDAIAALLAGDEGKQKIAAELGCSGALQPEQIAQWLCNCDIAKNLEDHVRDASLLQFKAPVNERTHPSITTTRPKENCCIVARVRESNIYIEAYLNKSSPPLHARKVTL